MKALSILRVLEEEINLVFFAVLDSTPGYVDPAYRTFHSLRVEIITESFKLDPVLLYKMRARRDLAPNSHNGSGDHQDIIPRLRMDCSFDLIALTVTDGIHHIDPWYESCCKHEPLS